MLDSIYLWRFQIHRAATGDRLGVRCYASIADFVLSVLHFQRHNGIMKATELIVRCLENEGVGYIYSAAAGHLRDHRRH